MRRFAWLLLLFPACGEAPAPPLVSAEWLRGHRGDVVLLDAQGGKELYEKGHAKGALWIDLDQLRTETKRIASADALAQRFGALGIDEETHVVVYDEKRGRNAGYVWYALKQLGHERVSLLDGHMDGFARELEQGPPPAVEAKRYRPRRGPEVVSTDWVRERIGKVAMLDARAAHEYTGEKPKEGMKGGHIPGAASVPWDSFTGRDGRYLGEEAARAVLRERVGRELLEDEEIVLYCNSYQQAAHLHWVLARLGYTNLRAYDASMNEWERTDAPRTAGARP